LDHEKNHIIELPKYKKLKKKRINARTSLKKWLNLLTIDEDVIKKPKNFRHDSPSQ